MKISPSDFGAFLEIFKAETVFVMSPHRAYFDESGTHDGSRFVCVAGYLFSKESALEFESLFAVHVRPILPAGVSSFHAAECIGRKGKFFGISQEHSKEIVNAMVSAILATALYGVVIGIDPVIYRAEISRQSEFGRLAGRPYTLCSVRCMDYVSEWMNEKEISESVTYLFEAGADTDGELSRYLSAVTNNEALRSRYRFNGYGFPTKLIAPPLQAADLLAWEWQRAYRSTALEEPYREWRLTLARLAEKPHHAALIQDAGIGAQALINLFHGIGK